jgi:hypothetical protein
LFNVNRREKTDKGLINDFGGGTQPPVNIGQCRIPLFGPFS